MTTFTLRASDVMAARLNSAETRNWLDAFLRSPHDILDPGPGQARVSLTLPEAEVKAAAAYLQCSPSSALRRLAGERLGNPRPMTFQAPDVVTPGSNRMTPQSPARNRPPVLPRTTAPILQQDKKIRFQGEALLVMVFIVVILSVMSCVLFISRKEKSDKQHDTHDATNA
jgi:hypothetical protein